MKFEVIPTLKIMSEIYEQPRDLFRFKDYLSKLQGSSKGDLELPIMGFNPMAKDRLIGKLNDLIDLDAEGIAQQVIHDFNKKNAKKSSPTFHLALNLSDDAHGSWTNRYTADYQSKFQIQALLRRNFCTPIFWSSEEYSRELIEDRTREYLYRTLLWTKLGKPLTLEDHIELESAISDKTQSTCELSDSQMQTLSEIYELYKKEDDHALIFNFLYGDKASESLGYTTFGNTVPFGGFEYAKARN